MRVLLAEDHPDVRTSLETALSEWGYEVLTAKDGPSAWHLLQQHDAPQLVILDWMMPGMTGLDLCRHIRSQSDRPYTYILLLTARTQKQDIIEGLNAGADDYLGKPVDLNELEARLKGGQRILDLQNQLISARDALRDQAMHDALTGLWNRRAILDILHREVARSLREHLSIAVMMVDLDHFKAVNDTYGHQAGDAVLFEISRRMRTSIRPYDTVGRYGGEEFLVVLPGCSASNTAKLAERLREHVATEPVNLPSTKVPVTISLGVSISGDSHTLNADTLISTADAALYRAKRAGRNRVEVLSAPEVPRKGLGDKSGQFITLA